MRAENSEFSAAHRFGQTRLAAGKDRDQRHAKRRGQMKQSGVDADDELRARDQPRDTVERLTCRHARAGGEPWVER